MSSDLDYLPGPLAFLVVMFGGIVMTALGAWFLWVLVTQPWLSDLNRDIALVAKWNVAEATIDEVGVLSETRGEESTYTAKIAYRYKVEGIEYTSNCLSLKNCTYVGRGLSNKVDAFQRIADFVERDTKNNWTSVVKPAAGNSGLFESYRPVKNLKIRYNPKDPKIAVVDYRDYADFTFAGYRDDYRPVSWNDYYGSVIFGAIIMLLCGLPTLLISFLLLRSALTHRQGLDIQDYAEVARPQPKVLGCFNPQKHTYRFSKFGLTYSFFLGCFAIFCFFTVFEFSITPGFNDGTIGASIAKWILSGLFLIAGIPALLRPRLVLEMSSRIVHQRTSLWPFPFLVLFKRQYSFGQFSEVMVKNEGYETRVTSSICTVLLKFSKGTGGLTLYSSATDYPEPPPDVVETANTIAQAMGVPCRIENNAEETPQRRRKRRKRAVRHARAAREAADRSREELR